MTSSTAGPDSEGRDLVVGVDGSAGALGAVRWAIDEARLRNLRVVVVCAWDVPHADEYPSIALTAEIHRRQEEADRAIDAALAIDHDGVQMIVLALQGDPRVVLLDESAGQAMLVTGSRGRGGFASLLLGSVSEHCARHGTAPTVIVPAGAPPHTRPSNRVVVGVDGSTTARAALDWAIVEATRRDATLEVVHAWANTNWTYARTAQGMVTPGPIGEANEEMLRDIVAEALADADDQPPDVVQVVTDQVASAALLERAKTASLLVVGSRGRGQLGGLLLGSVSQPCIHHTPCPIVVIHPDRKGPDAGLGTTPRAMDQSDQVPR